MSARVSPAPWQRDPLIGTVIADRYRIDRIHAQGGMSVVYAASYEAQQREVAIKVIDDAYSSDPKAIERFMHEARTASAISHGHVVGVSDFGVLPSGRPYLVMPLIMGVDLATLVAEHGPLPAARVVALLTGVASALDWMHAQGLVHRDIKSENIMYVRGDDGTESALVLDFGIAARASGDDDDASGTPDFMAPEALAGEPADHRADIYSLATVAFELLAGRLPFHGKDLPELLRNRASHRPRTLTEATRVAYHPALEAAIAHGLARAPADRPSSAGAFVEELRRAAARARAPLSAPPAAKVEFLPLPGTAKANARRPVVRLRTLVGFPFKPSANTVDADEVPREPEPLPSIIIDPSLIARPTPGIEAAPVIEAVPATHTPLASPDSLSPLGELDAPTFLRSRPAWLRFALPAAAVAVALLIFALASSDSAQPEAASAPPSALEPAISNKTPAPPAQPPQGPITAPVPSPEPEAAITPAPEPSTEPEPAEPRSTVRRPRERSSPASQEPRPTPRASASAESASAKQLTTEGVDAMLRGQFGAALDKLNAATAADPRYAPAYRSKGLVLERMKRSNDAAQAFRQYLRLAPRASDASKIKARLDALSRK